MAHEVRGLLWAREGKRPEGLPTTRARGAKAEGLKYERALGKTLGPAAKAGMWWEFGDESGRRFCQTDLVLAMPEGLMVLECKYTYTEEAWAQLENLYLPVLSAATDRFVVGVQVCKNLRRGVQNVVWTLEDAWNSAVMDRRTVLHWSGKGPLERNWR